MGQRIRRGHNLVSAELSPVDEAEIVSPQEIRAEFERIVVSRQFRHSPRQCQILRFLMERHLADTAERVSESDIAVAVFKRQLRASEDRTVGVSGWRLRRALSAYYRTEGRDDPIRLHLPERGYGLRAERARQPMPIEPAQAPAPGPPTWYRIEVSTLVALDAQGRECFRHQFERPLDPDAYPGRYRNRRAVFSDIDDDGRTETLFTEWPINIGEVGARVFCFSDTGKLKWPPFIPGRRVATDKKDYPPLFFISNVQAIPTGPERQMRILVSSNHHLHNPNQIAMLDPKNGSLISEYWHAGHLLAIVHADIDGDGGEEVVAAGVNNGFGLATLIVFDAENIQGASSQSGRRWLALPWGSERAVVLFPKTCLAAHQQYNRVSDLRLIPPRRILVVVSESIKDEGDQGLILYELDYDLKVLSAAPDSVFLNLHRERELEGGHAWSQAEAEQLIKQVKIYWPSKTRPFR